MGSKWQILIKGYIQKSLTIKLQSREKNIELSKYLWELKERDVNCFINWVIALKSQKYV